MSHYVHVVVRPDSPDRGEPHTNQLSTIELIDFHVSFFRYVACVSNDFYLKSGFDRPIGTESKMW